MILALFGGAGTVWGPLIGAVILVPLSEALRAELGGSLPGLQGILYGVAIILVILLAPEGVYWRLRDFLVGRRPPAPVIAENVAQPPPRPRPPRCETILSVDALSRSYGGLRAVHNVTFNVASGEILGIIGPNGAGKTTLFNLINGVVRPSAGRVLFEGQDITGLKPSRICQAGIGRTFQVVRAFPRMSLIENVLVGAFVAHGNDAAALAGAAQVLARVGLDHRTEAPAGSLTTKELRLMELARALAGSPKLVLLDEPLAGLGAAETEEFVALIRSLPADGITVIMIDHTMKAMVSAVDRFLVLDYGECLTEGDPEVVTKDPRVIEAYLGRKWMKAHAPA
jgi:ABC-type branched-subunit amino acid transport system ATPase component